MENLVEFRAILSDDEVSQRFRKYLKKVHSDENLSFWLAAEKYRKTKDNRGGLYHKILTRYFYDGSPHQINVESDQLREIWNNDIYDPPANVFCSVQQDILETLVNVCVPDFRTSKYYYPQVTVEDTSPKKTRFKIFSRRKNIINTATPGSSPDSQNDSAEMLREYVQAHQRYPRRCSYDSSDDLESRQRSASIPS